MQSRKKHNLSKKKKRIRCIFYMLVERNILKTAWQYVLFDHCQGKTTQNYQKNKMIGYILILMRRSSLKK